jgi:diadenylate cyclase
MMAGEGSIAAKTPGDARRGDAKGEVRVSDVLRRVAPGTELREGLDNIISASGGALIVIGDTSTVQRLCDGGFSLDVPFTPQRLFELSKMDGAILLDDECRTILRANVHLVPNAALPTAETGMRHRTAERVSRQTSALVISVSQRRNVVSLYQRGRKVIVQDVTVVLAKANQALQTLQRYRSRLDEVMSRLTLFEFEDAVTVGEVVEAIQRSQLVQRVAREVARSVTELGTEGRLVAMQAEEVTANVADEHALLLRDYVAGGGQKQASVVRFLLSDMTQDQLLDDEAVAAALGFPNTPDILEAHVRSRGYRAMRRIPSLPATVINRLVERFSALPAIAAASETQLDDVDGVGARRAHAIAEGLRRLKESSAP